MTCCTYIYFLKDCNNNISIQFMKKTNWSDIRYGKVCYLCLFVLTAVEWTYPFHKSYPHTLWHKSKCNNWLGQCRYFHVDTGGWHIRWYLEKNKYYGKQFYLFLTLGLSVESRLNDSHNYSLGIVVCVTLTDHDRTLSFAVLVYDFL